MQYAAVNRLSRPGFSLVELLVVLAIIAVLFSLAAGATFQVIGVQRTSNTETGMRSIDKVFRTHWDYVTKEAAKEEPSAAVLALADNNVDRARVIWVKLRQTEAFPQCYEEVKIAMSEGGIYATIDPIKGPFIPKDRRKYMSKYWAAVKATMIEGPPGVFKYITDPSKAFNPLSESSACLFLSLSSVSRGGNKLDEANMASNITDTDGDGIKEFVDGFGKPLRFQRFLCKPNMVGSVPPYDRWTPLNRWTPAPPSAALNIIAALTLAQDELLMTSKRGDPNDPDGTLRQAVGTLIPKWCSSPNGITFASVCNLWFPGDLDGAMFFPSYSAAGGDPAALSQPYFLPHLISNGRDEIPFTDDDIYSFRLLRLGSAGS